jgi:DNA-binding NarL/FixJ family response regulator
MLDLMIDDASSNGQEPLTVNVQLSDPRQTRLMAAELTEAGYAVTASGSIGRPSSRSGVLVTNDLDRLGSGQAAIYLAAASVQTQTVRAALNAGASVLTASDGAGTAQLQAAINATAAGLIVVPGALLADLTTLPGTPSAPQGDRERTAALAAKLTAREREVLDLMAQGDPNKTIARRLGITIHTVKFHVAAILDKLDATGRTDAVAQGARLGLVML